MSAIDHIGFMFKAFQEGFIRMKPLAHGLDSLCLEIINNDYTRYQRCIKNLKDEIDRVSNSIHEIPELARQRVGYLESLCEANNTIEFWTSLSQLYYGVPENAAITPRTHTNARKLVEFNPSTSRKKKDVQNNMEKRKGHVQKSGRKNRRKTS